MTDPGRAATTAPAGRRPVLRFLAGLPAVLTIPRREAPTPPGEGAAILVAGPEGGELDRWGRLIGSLLPRFLPPGASVRLFNTGAADGVTGANQFDARVSPDGGTALLVPGTAALAALAGDPRVHFNAGQWLPLMTGITSGVVAGRTGSGVLTPRPRVAAATPSGPDIAALLALDLLGAEPVPVFGLMEFDAVRAAFARREVDLALVCGPQVPSRLAALAAVGAQPVFSLGMADRDGRPARDAAFPDLPDVTEVYGNRRRAPPSGRLFQGWAAAATAAQLAFSLVVPRLASAAWVAQWRRASAGVASAPEFRSAAAAAAVQSAAPPGSATSALAVTPDTDAVLELRRWLGTRFNWQTG